MRWVVELPAGSGGTGASVTTDGESWKVALAAARSGKPLPKFRCEFEEDGTIRVWDMATNERFTVRPMGVAPATPVVGPAPPALGPLAEASASARAQSVPPPAAPAESSRRTGTVPPPAMTNGATAAPHADPESAQASPTAADAASVSVPPPGALIFQRNVDPTPATPLLFLERVVALPGGSDAVLAERVARELWQALRARFAGAARGQFVSIAVFDHVFASRPERAPLVVLQWKDWRGEAPDVTFVAPPPPVELTTTPTGRPVTEGPARRAASERPVAQSVVLAPPARPASVPPSPQAPEDALAAVRPFVPSAPPVAPPPAVDSGSGPSPLPSAAFPPPVVMAPPEATTRATPASRLTTAEGRAENATQLAPKPPPASERHDKGDRAAGAGPRRGEELLAEAFEATLDLAFLQDSEEACRFAATMVRTLLHVPAVVIFQYDIDKDELVVSGVEGLPEATLGRRGPLAQGPRGEAAIRGRVIALDASPGDDTIVQNAPTGPAMFTPVREEHRLFGAIQVHREPGAARFEDDQQQAVWFVATQLAKFLAAHSKRVGFKDDERRRV